MRNRKRQAMPQAQATTHRRANLLRQRLWRAGLLLVAGILAPIASVGAAAPDPSRGETLILEKESIYNTIYVYERAGHRYLKFGHSAKQYIESIYNPADVTALPSVYTRFMTLGAAYADKLERAVVVGMGGGRTTWYLAHHVPDLQITGVELDPEIVKIAAEHFDVKPGGNLSVAEQDGRIFFRRDKATRYDIIMVDAYRGPFVPFHLLTKEYYALLESRLADGGVVVQNIEPTTMLFDHALATIGAVFDQVDLYPARGNFVAVAHNGPRMSLEALLARANARQQAHGFRYDLARLAEDRVAQTPTVTAEKVLTDDFAPANYLRSVKRHNRRWEEQLKSGQEPNPIVELLQSRPQ